MASRPHLERSFDSVATAFYANSADHSDLQRVQALMGADACWVFPAEKSDVQLANGWARRCGWDGAHLCTPVQVIGTGQDAHLAVIDYNQALQQARQAKCALVVDISMYTPALVRPLAHGADAVLCNLNRQIFPNAAQLFPIVLGFGNLERHKRSSDKKHASCGSHQLPSSQANAGTAHDGWLTSSAVHPVCAPVIDLACSTMTMRMQARNTHTLALARYLDAHPAVQTVSYPGLAHHSDHRLAQQVFVQGYGPALLMCVQTSASRVQHALSTTPFVYTSYDDINGMDEDLCASSHDKLAKKPTLSQLYKKRLDASSFEQVDDDLQSCLEATSPSSAQEKYSLSQVCFDGSQSACLFVTHITHLPAHSSLTQQVLMVEPGFESIPDAVAAWETFLHELSG